MPANAIDPTHSEETRKYVLKNLAQYLFHLSRTIQHPDQIGIERGGTYPDREPLRSAAIAIGNLHHDMVQALNTLLLVRQLPDHVQTRKAVNILARLGDGWQAAIASAQLSIDMGDDDAAIKICEVAISEARAKFANTIESIGGKLAASAAFGLPIIAIPLSADDARNKFSYEEWQRGQTYKEIFVAVKQHHEWVAFTEPLAVRAGRDAWANSKNPALPIRKGARGRRPHAR